MTKKRVYELAKDLDWDNRRVIDALARIGVEVKNHMSVIENAESVLATIRSRNSASDSGVRPPSVPASPSRPAEVARDAERPLVRQTGRPATAEVEKASVMPAASEGRPSAAKRPAAEAPLRPSAELPPGLRPAARLFNKEDLRRQDRSRQTVTPGAYQFGSPRAGNRTPPKPVPQPPLPGRQEVPERRPQAPAGPEAPVSSAGHAEVRTQPVSRPPVPPTAPAHAVPSGQVQTRPATPAAAPDSRPPAAARPPEALRPEKPAAPAAFHPPARPYPGGPLGGTGQRGDRGGPAPMNMSPRPGEPIHGPRPGIGPGRPPGMGPGRPGPGGPRPAGGPGGPRPGFTPRPGSGPGRPSGRPGGRLNIPPPPPQVQQQAQTQSRPAAKGGPRREQNHRWKEGDQRYLDKRVRRNDMGRGQVAQPPRNLRPIVIEGPLTVKELGIKMAVTAADIIKHLLRLGVMVTINQEIDVDTIEIVLTEMGYPYELKLELTEADMDAAEESDDPADLVPRAPVVTIMGHVDHGKTSLLDAIRETRVAAGEAGGITQHIGAYMIELRGRNITFLDTPGHEAFTAMRARGAQVTDVAVLVVAADDGVMPQTIEAINHAKAAGVPIVVAVNKIDKPGANPDRVKQELTEHGLVAEEWGGDTVMVQVSAKQRQNLDQLLEMILLVADVRDLKANPNKLARGTIIESKLDKGRGPVATVLIQSGTLNVGDALVAGGAFCRVRALLDDKGKRVKKAGPSTPVEVLGFGDVPQAGDIAKAYIDEKTGREIAEKRAQMRRQTEMGVSSRLTLEDLQKRITEGELRDLNVVIKADVHGSAEALKGSLTKLRNEEVKVNVIHSGVGAITESDVMLSMASGAIIIGFHVRPDPNARIAAERESVDIRLYRVIYDAVEDVQAAMKGMLKPKMHEVTLGHAEIRALFKVPKIGTAAGCYVLDGKITKNAQVRLLRDNVVIYEGKLSSLKRFKDDVREVASGFECGLALENFNDLKEGDQIEAFVIEEVKPA